MTDRELDALVAEKVMGWTRPRIRSDNVPPCPVADFDYANPPPELEAWRSDYYWRERGGACWRSPPHYSTDMRAAWQIVKHVPGDFALRRSCEVTFGDGSSDSESFTAYFAGSADATAPTAPLAICLAAFKSVGVTIQSPLLATLIADIKPIMRPAAPVASPADSGS